MLVELPADVVQHATLFLHVRMPGALDITCQRFHPIGLTQKACMLRANMCMLPSEWARVERGARSWPEWLDDVEFRGTMRQRPRGRIATGGDGTNTPGELTECPNFTLEVQEDGGVWARGNTIVDVDLEWDGGVSLQRFMGTLAGLRPGCRGYVWCRSAPVIAMRCCWQSAARCCRSDGGTTAALGTTATRRTSWHPRPSRPWPARGLCRSRPVASTRLCCWRAARC